MKGQRVAMDRWKQAAWAVFLGVLIPSGAMASAPPQLYGKTVTVSWTADIVRRTGTEETFSHKQHPRTATIYVSSAGRLFIQIHTITRGHGGHGGGALDEQVGESGQTSVGGSQTADFHGNALTVISAYQGGAQRVQVNFDGNYASCTASVISGKESGRNTFTRLNGAKERVEVQSESSSSATCAIETGNAFAR
jgi:hypothetical protein